MAAWCTTRGGSVQYQYTKPLGGVWYGTVNLQFGRPSDNALPAMINGFKKGSSSRTEDQTGTGFLRADRQP